MAKRAKQDPKRDAKGRILPGHGSLNPGGVPKEALELRRLALLCAPRAIERAQEMMEEEDPRASEAGIRIILGRALGREGAPSELPETDEGPPEVDTSPTALLDLSKRALGRVLAHFDRKAGAGQPVTATDIETVADAAKTLSVLQREERELAKSGPGSDLSDEALVGKVLAAVSIEQLKAALSARKAVK